MLTASLAPALHQAGFVSTADRQADARANVIKDMERWLAARRTRLERLEKDIAVLSGAAHDARLLKARGLHADLLADITAAERRLARLRGGGR